MNGWIASPFCCCFEGSCGTFLCALFCAQTKYTELVGKCQDKGVIEKSETTTFTQIRGNDGNDINESLHTVLRKKIRKKYDIGGGDCEDCLCVYCCPPCALTQELVQVKEPLPVTAQHLLRRSDGVYPLPPNGMPV